MFRTLRIALSCCLAFPVFLAKPRTAHAGYIYEMIPASACEPQTNWSNVFLQEGSWRFASGTGSITFVCNVRSSFFYIDGNQTTQTSQISGLFLMYMDPDVGSTYSINASLYRSTSTENGWTKVGSTLAPIGNNPGTDKYDDECLVPGFCDAHTMLDAHYQIRVILTRTSTADNPRFTAVGLTVVPPA